MKICYINFNLNNPRDQITILGLKENGIEVKEIYDNTPGFVKYINIAKKYKSLARECDLVMIGYSGNLLLIFIRLITRKKIVLNTLSTFYDSMVVSRFGGVILSPRSIFYYLIDFASFHLADRVFIECQAQKNLAVKILLINPDKLSIHFIGVDERDFYFDSSIEKNDQFTVFFRGMFLPEGGADIVVMAAKELEEKNIKFKLIGRGFLLKEIKNLIGKLKPKNLEFIENKVSFEMLRKIMLECHISLGQLANHKRVHTTIPHKAFESMVMKLPYLTGDNKGIKEVLEDNKTCFIVPPGDYKALARKIIELKDSPKELEKVAEESYKLYKQKFTPKILAQKIINELEYLN